MLLTCFHGCLNAILYGYFSFRRVNKETIIHESEKNSARESYILDSYAWEGLKNDFDPLCYHEKKKFIKKNLYIYIIFYYIYNINYNAYWVDEYFYFNFINKLLK